MLNETLDQTNTSWKGEAFGQRLLEQVEKLWPNASPLPNSHGSPIQPKGIKPDSIAAIIQNFKSVEKISGILCALLGARYTDTLHADLETSKPIPKIVLLGSVVSASINEKTAPVG
jgi:hypothetical protein